MNAKRVILYAAVLLPLLFGGCVNINFPGIWNGGGDDDCGDLLPIQTEVYIVSGAGTGLCDGTYEKEGEIEGKPFYKKDGTTCTIEYDPVKGWCIKESCTVLYHCDTDEVKPPESFEYDWLAFYGDPPVPIVQREVETVLVPACF
ncbi:MAG: hypothetical protein JW838_05565 [Spirochaetes bacterium]|nr:hypothetical protein [Spirochaetota bacterium]